MKTKIIVNNIFKDKKNIGENVKKIIVKEIREKLNEEGCHICKVE